MFSPQFLKSNARLNGLIDWLPIIIGLLFLYVPTYIGMANNVWVSEDQAHGPLILMLIIYLFWIKRLDFLQLPQKPRPVLGWTLFVTGLLLYTLGRSQDVVAFDVGSQIFVLAGLILLTVGSSALKLLWFPLFFMLFMIPLPGFILDSLTLPMKIAVSNVAEHVLYWFDYPIARRGVVLQIGQYQLLVADACAGMHTLISLEALGLLYLQLVRHDSWFRNVSLAVLIVPISFTANVIRVIVLTLVTYHFGDEAGQGFVHGFAGMVLFIVALTLIMSVDSLLQFIAKKREFA